MSTGKNFKFLCNIRENNIEAVKTDLLKNPELVRSKKSDVIELGLNASPLRIAINKGHEKMVELLIEFGADVNEKFAFFSKGSYGFLCVITYLDVEDSKKIKLATILMKYGANVNEYSDSAPLTPLQHAVLLNNFHYVEFLLRNGARLKGPECIGSNKTTFGQYEIATGMFVTPLYLAIHHNSRSMFQLFVDFGAEINEKCVSTGMGYLELLSFFDYEESAVIEFAKILIQNGADVNCLMDSTLVTPIQRALQCGHLQYVDFLLQNGARLEIGPEWDDKLPIDFLLCSPKLKQKKMLELLINHGLDINQRKANGMDYLMITILKACPKKESERIDILEIARLLLNSGLSANSRDNTDTPTLIKAVQLRDTELLSLLMENGADVNEKVHQTSLIMCVLYNDIKTMKFLLSKSANINMRNTDEYTALHAACYQRRKKIINFLIENGADISAKSRFDTTPLSSLLGDGFIAPDMPCIRIMLKEIARVKFFDSTDNVSSNDLDLIQSNPKAERFFQDCMKELCRISRTKFYALNTYYSVWRMSRYNIKKTSASYKE